jgi:putative chitinase
MDDDYAMIDREKFFAQVRKDFGNLNQSQVDGFNKILDEWERRGLTDLRWLGYMLATSWHETACTMQPIQERGSAQYLRNKPYWPYIGEGLVQVTWKRNYEKFGAKEPGDLLQWPLALKALFDGMIDGLFTGMKLSRYFHDRYSNPVEARRIINGTDRANLIAGYYRHFMAALGAKP